MRPSLPTHNRVAVYYSNHDIRVETRALAPPGFGELVFEVNASGICGSDIMEWYRRPSAPVVLGHEVAGRVVAVGDGVERFHPGDRIVATHHVPCLACRYCRSGRETACELLRTTRFDPGGFAAFVRVPPVNVAHGVLPLPPQVSDEAGSMVEPLACVVRGQRKAGVAPGDAVLVIGAGVSGCLHLLAARAYGAEPVFAADPQPERRRMASELGATRVFDAGQPVAAAVRRELGRGVDRVIVCTGAREAIAQALAAVDRGGTVLFFAPMGSEDALSLPFNQVFWQHEATLASSYGAAPRDLAEALDLIATGRAAVDRLVTHRLPLEQIQRGFTLMLEARDSLKIVIDPRLGG
jgi:L-iditol 2-dehydrogenase